MPADTLYTLFAFLALSTTLALSLFRKGSLSNVVSKIPTKHNNKCHDYKYTCISVKHVNGSYKPRAHLELTQASRKRSGTRTEDYLPRTPPCLLCLYTLYCEKQPSALLVYLLT